MYSYSLSNGQVGKVLFDTLVWVQLFLEAYKGWFKEEGILYEDI